MAAPVHNPLQRWMRKASAQDKKRLAEEAGTSVHTLYTAARASRTKGLLSLVPEFARRLERAAAEVRKSSLYLPELKREQMAPDCASCDMLKKCRKMEKES